MTRRCSHCSNNGHNSRTCPNRGGGGGCVKLFGVKLTDGSIIKKSASMGNLSAHYHSSSSAAASPNYQDSPSSDPVHVSDGYLSDDPAHASCSANRRGDRKKGVPWTEEEHRLFLVGLQKLGKGDWRGIARNFVTSRTPTQVASHAQKYFIRQSNANRKKRRSSLFDMVPDTATDTPPVPEEQVLLSSAQVRATDTANFLPSLNLSLNSEFEPMEASPQEEVEELNESVAGSTGLAPMIPQFFPAYLPLPFPIWPPNTDLMEEEKGAESSYHQVLKPIPILPKHPVNVDELVGMSQLSLGEAERGHREPSPLSLKLIGEPSRQSAFHANASVSGSDLNKGESSVIEAV
ncbi:transcription factor MYBS3-like [Juglans microcarpa x Juglans regia]|uniref:transcription factor MYBS3-like n=1 Tax=Juglans microcarpa x Juglans regia TaxID=2249226 RepID=UPI001B7EE41C|nr:transcription factor MYBS3-like [Juglans microcarpa x Juglans regia]XP_041002057.1 transcription factor MYBS3-like [Juglans microcarpa x Juglans regia]